MKEKLRMGVIGLGMGRGHAVGYSTHPQAELVALCDLDGERLKNTAAELGVEQTFSDFAAMLKECDLDGVSIAIPNKLHAAFTIKALKAGVHVLCEKPMATTVKDAKRMQAAADAVGRNLMINFSFRFTEASRMLKEQVEAGAIGDIYFGRSMWHRHRGAPGGWFSDRESAGGGPLIDLGVHRLDLALWLMGYPQPVAVTGSTFDHLARAEQPASFTVEDLGCGMVKFANGACLMLEASWMLNIPPGEQMRTTLYGTRGSLEQRFEPGESQHIGEVISQEGSSFVSKRLLRRTVANPSAYHEFVDSIVEGRPPLATGAEGIKVMQILEGIYKSAATGREVAYRER